MPFDPLTANRRALQSFLTSEEIPYRTADSTEALRQRACEILNIPIGQENIEKSPQSSAKKTKKSSRGRASQAKNPPEEEFSYASPIGRPAVKIPEGKKSPVAWASPSSPAVVAESVDSDEDVDPRFKVVHSPPPLVANPFQSPESVKPARRSEGSNKPQTEKSEARRRRWTEFPDSSISSSSSPRSPSRGRPSSPPSALASPQPRPSQQTPKSFTSTTSQAQSPTGSASRVYLDRSRPSRFSLFLTAVRSACPSSAREFLGSAMKFAIRTLAIVFGLLFVAVLIDSLSSGLLGFSRPTIFCPSSDSAPRLGSPENPCVPCPPHGFCTDAGQLRCDPGYIVQDKECVFDTLAIQQASRIGDFLVQELAERAGLFECGEAPSRGLTMKEMREWWKTRENVEFEPAMEDFIWKNVQDFLTKHQSSIVVDEAGLFQSENPSHPLLCRLRLTIYRNQWFLISVGLLLSLIVSGYFSLKRFLKRRQAAAALAEEIRTFLAEQDEALAVEHIRDEFRYSPNDPVWILAVKQIEADTRIQRIRMPHGEIVFDCWQWIAKKSSRKSLSGRQSNRFSESAQFAGFNEVGHPMESEEFSQPAVQPQAVARSRFF